MKNLTMLGRYIFSIAIMAFGIQHFVYASSGYGLGPPWTPVNHLLAYFAGVVLIVVGISLATGKQARLGAIILGALFLLRGALYYLPKVFITPRDPGPWTSAFELLMLAGASLILAATLTKNAYAGRASHPLAIMFPLGRILFAAALVVFGVQHLMYGRFVAGLVPMWIPARVFWAYFIGVAFIAAALAIVTGKLATIASSLLGTMFTLWVFILHAPRVAGDVHSGNEWTSLIVALAAGGSAFVVGGASQARVVPRSGVS
jgi:uncharacterized membrane protein